jgi:diguanylate cyclase (GGDEF)-like protein/PAS domain S-box-containing protein
MFDQIPSDQQIAVYRAMTGSSPLAFVYIDVAGNVITCNPAFETLFGYSLGEMTGKHIDYFISNKESLQEALDLTLRVTSSEFIKVTSTRYKRDGSKVIVESQGIPVEINGKVAGVLVQYHDVTDLVNSEKKASDISNSFKLLLDSIDADVYVSDMDTFEILFMNKHMEESFGRNLIGKKCYEEYRKDSSPCPHCTNMYLVNEKGEPTDGVVWEGYNPVTARWYKNSDKSVYWTNNKLVRIQIATDITEMKAAKSTLEDLVLHDPLTSLPNRSLFNDRIDHAIKTHKREKNKFAVMFLDLDNFKSINDTFGHLAGDFVLKVLSGRIKECIRESDTLARVSGDEFTVLLNNVHQFGEIEIVAGRILESLQKEVVYNDFAMKVTCSIGVSLFPEDGSNIDTLVSNADFAMYRAKSLGGNNTCFYSTNK